MKSTLPISQPFPRLADLEREVVAEAREWGRQRLEERLQELADRSEKLCFTVTATGSYEEAVQVASRWASGIADATRHALVQRVGTRAEHQARSRYEPPPQERLARWGRTELGVIMVDGCQVRYRGARWGKKRPNNCASKGTN